MSAFDLIFIACFFGTVFYGGWIAWLMIRRHWSHARRHAFRLGGALGVYLLIVIVVGCIAPRRELAPDGILRYDDWCLAVDRAAFADTIGSDARSAPGGRFVIVTLNVMSQARRVRQAAPAGSLVFLIDRDGMRYDVAERGQAAFERLNGAQPELTTKLDPNAGFRTTRVFEVPRSSGELSLGHRHGSGARFPGLFIIGVGFRKPPVIRLNP